MFLRIKCHDRLVLHCCEQRIGCCRNACIVLFEKAAEHQDLQRRECDAVLCVQDGERARCGVQLDGALSAEGLADKWLIWLEKWHVQCPPTCSTGTPLAYQPSRRALSLASCRAISASITTCALCAASGCGRRS